MIDRIKLREEYKQETGNNWKMLQSTAQPTVDYTKWLEDRLVKNCSIPDVVGRSEQLYVETACKCENKDSFNRLQCPKCKPL